MLEKKEEIFQNAEIYLNFDMKKNIHKNDLLRFLDLYLERYDIPFDQTIVIEMKTRMATFLNDESLFEQTVANMESIYADKRIFMEEYFAKSDDWKNFLVSIFSNRQAMLDKIEENIANGKIKAQVELLP